MKKLKFNGFYIVAMTISAVAAFQEKWGIAVWMTLMLVLVELDQIHDTIKAAHGIKGDA